MKFQNIKFSLSRLLLSFVFAMGSMSAALAKCGAVDYSWGADGLEEATSFVGTMMIYTVEILYAVAAVMAIISSLQIGIKMNYHEGGHHQEHDDALWCYTVYDRSYHCHASSLWLPRHEFRILGYSNRDR